MKKLLLVLVLLFPLDFACYKSKPVEVEMQLPVPIAIFTPTAIMSPTPLIEQPTPTATPSLQYAIEDIKGTALIIPADDTLPEEAEEGESVEAGDQLITKDNSEMTLALNDNTMIHLYANCQINVVGLTPNATHGFSSRIELMLGNILSEVEKLNQSKSSFEVESGGVVCGVRGTAFEVQNQGGNISTSTFHGMVEMRKDDQTQKVNSNEHSTFSIKNVVFLKQRRLSPAEKKHYQSWIRKKAIVQKKREDRIARQATGQLHVVKKSASQAAKKLEKLRTIKKSKRSIQPRAKKNARGTQLKARKQAQMKLKRKPEQTTSVSKLMTSSRILQPKKKRPTQQKQSKTNRRHKKKVKN